MRGWAKKYMTVLINPVIVLPLTERSSFPLRRFLAKTLRVIKIVMKKFLKNLLFGVDFKL